MRYVKYKGTNAKKHPNTLCAPQPPCSGTHTPSTSTCAMHYLPPHAYFHNSYSNDMPPYARARPRPRPLPTPTPYTHTPHPTRTHTPHPHVQAAKAQKKANKAAGLGNVMDQQIVDEILADAKATKLLPSPALAAFGEQTLRQHMAAKDYAVVASLLSATVQAGGKWDFKLPAADIAAILSDKDLLFAYKMAGVDFAAMAGQGELKSTLAAAEQSESARHQAALGAESNRQAAAKQTEAARTLASKQAEAEVQQKVAETIARLKATEAARQASARQTEDQRHEKAVADEKERYRLAELREERKLDFKRAIQRAQKLVAPDTNKYRIVFGEFLEADGGKANLERVLLDALAADIKESCDAKGAAIEQPDVPGVDQSKEKEKSKYVKGLQKTFKKEMAKTDAILATIAAASEAKLHIGAPKDPERLFEKAELSYGNNLQRVTDYERRALEFAAFNEMTKALQMIFRDLDVIRIKNRFEKGNEAAKRTGAYRDVQLTCYVKGTKLLIEVQLHLTCILEVKSKVAASKGADGSSGHDRYISFRLLKEEADSEYGDIKGAADEDEVIDPEPEHLEKMAALEELHAQFESREKETQAAAAADIAKMQEDDAVRHTAVVGKWAAEEQAFDKAEVARHTAAQGEEAAAQKEAATFVAELRAKIEGADTGFGVEGADTDTGFGFDGADKQANDEEFAGFGN